MPTSVELAFAYNLLSLVRAKKFLQEDRKWSEEEVRSWLRWANSCDPLYDWPFVLATHMVTDFSAVESYPEAKEIWTATLVVGSTVDIDAEGAIATIIFWLEGQEGKLEQVATWDGVIGDHYVDWSPELGGHVKIWPEGIASKSEPNIFKL